MSGRRLAGALALVAVALAGTAWSGFLLDDTLHLARAAAARSGAVDGAIVPGELGLYTPSGAAPVAFTYWRPFTALSLLVDYRLFGLRPFAFHLVNLLLHLLNVLQARALGRRLGLGPRPALAAALAWGLSLPAGLAAGWISGRSELLAAALVLGALQLALRGRDAGDRRLLAAAAIMLVLGGLAKESALVAPLLVLIFSAAAGGPSAAGPSVAPPAPAHRDLRLAVGAALLADVLLRASSGGWPQLPPPYFQPPVTPTAAADLPLRLLVYLAGALGGLPVVPFAPVAALQAQPWALAPLALAVGGVLWVFARAVPRRARALGLAWFALALAPALPVMSFSLYLYLPLLGPCWLFGFALQSRAPDRPRAPGLARAWLGWLLVSGFALDLALSAALVTVGRHARAAEAVLASALAAAPTRDVVLVDAPFWAYALPVTARLRDPAPACRAHLVTFSPSLRPTPPSTLAWTGDEALSLSRPGRPYYDSPLERFFLFGNDPCHDGRVGAAATVACSSPTRLLVALHRSADGRLPLVLQFAGWDLHVAGAGPVAGSTTPASQ